LDITIGKHENLEDQNEPPLGTSQGNGALLGHELEAKVGPSTWTNMWVNKKANKKIWVGMAVHLFCFLCCTGETVALSSFPLS